MKQRGNSCFRSRADDLFFKVAVCAAAVTLLGGSRALAQSLVLSPQTTYVSTSAQAEITLTLSEPAPPGGAAVFLSLDPGIFGVVPDLVFLPEGETAGTFMFHALGVEGTEVVQAFEPTYGQGACEVRVLDAVDVIDPPEHPARTLRLLPASPNPFSNRTALRFDLSTTARVHLCVYDLSGRRVRRLADTFFPAGRHSVSWDGTDEAGSSVPFGVYLYRVTARGVTRTGRVALLR